VEFLREIGALAGLAAFLGLAVLALLYFSQARDLRRLRENASFLVENPDGQEAAGAEAAAGAASPAREKAAVAAPPANANQEQVEAFRRAELARQAAERRQRFERRRVDERSPAAEGGGRFGRPDATAIAVIVVGALLLAAGVAFGITQLVDDDGGGSGGGLQPQDVEVKVLNSTAVTGLAGQYTRQLKQKGFDASPFTTTIPLDVSEVMYEGRAQQEAAREVARALKIRKIGPLDDDYRPDAAGAPVVVVLGEDKAQGA
jgi:hypothetical protein